MRSALKKELHVLANLLTFLYMKIVRSWTNNRREELQNEVNELKQDTLESIEQMKKRKELIARLEALLLENPKFEDYGMLNEKFTMAAAKSDINSVKEYYYRGANVNARYG